MKKFIAIVACLAVVLSMSLFFVSCNDNADDNKNGNTQSYEMVVPDGAPALAVVNLLNELQTNGSFEQLKNIRIVQSSAISAEAVKADFAIVPANLAANLYNKGQKIKLVATVTQGNLYMLGANFSATSLSDLVGKQVFSIGQGSVPDYIFQSLLKANNIEYVAGEEATEGKVTITYRADGSGVMTELVKAINSGSSAVGILAEPAVTTAMSKGATQIFDLQELWKAHTQSETKGYPQAVLIASADICENNPQLVNKIVEKLKENAQFIVENSDKVDDILVTAYPQTTLNTNFSANTLERCNANCISIVDAKDDYIAMLNAIMQINATAIGGKLPDNGLYFS